MIPNDDLPLPEFDSAADVAVSVITAPFWLLAGATLLVVGFLLGWG